MRRGILGESCGRAIAGGAWRAKGGEIVKSWFSCLDSGAIEGASWGCRAWAEARGEAGYRRGAAGGVAIRVGDFAACF